MQPSVAPDPGQWTNLGLVQLHVARAAGSSLAGGLAARGGGHGLGREGEGRGKGFTWKMRRRLACLLFLWKTATPRARMRRASTVTQRAMEKGMPAVSFWEKSVTLCKTASTLVGIGVFNTK